MSKDASRDAFAPYLALLARWNPIINLVGRGDMASAAKRHLEDALQLAPLIPEGTARGIDLGSGAGFPGLVLAVATGIPFDLIEADQRKAAFLREAARILGAPVQVHPVRIEAAALPPAPLVTARALAPLPHLLDLAAPLLAPGGIALFPKGLGVAAELTAARERWHMQVAQIPSHTAAGAVILRITEIARAPARP
ncbi:MAG: 16S rRNA (guanine(527)-N(7))-methyltransferase RsmG [Proteobacteria bacterium]|nr:16S rRNA (guanine(527)-N(7))-methyltransferase RsmG [Pseudomonadota bacterium]